MSTVLEDYVVLLSLALKKLAYHSHFSCDEDGWYSCPQSYAGCLDEREGTACNCDANKHNQQVDDVLKLIPEKLRG